MANNGVGKSIPTAPPKPGSGRRILVWANSIYRWLMQNRIIPGQGLYARRTAAGTIVSLRPALVQSLTATHPFKITTTFDADTNEGLISVAYGLLNGAKDGTYTGEPTFDGGPGLVGADPAPTHGSGSTDGTCTVYAKVTIDSNYELSAGDIFFQDEGDSAPTDTAGSIYHWEIGSVTFTGLGTADRAVSATTQAVITSIAVRVCESDDLALWGPA